MEADVAITAIYAGIEKQVMWYTLKTKIPPKTSIIITDQNHNTVFRSVGNNFLHPFCFYSFLHLILVWPVFCVHLWFLEEIQYNFFFKASSPCHSDWHLSLALMWKTQSFKKEPLIGRTWPNVEEFRYALYIQYIYEIIILYIHVY